MLGIFKVKFKILSLMSMLFLFIGSIAYTAEDKDHIAYRGIYNSKIAFGLGIDGAWEPELPEGVTELGHTFDGNKVPISGRFEIHKINKYSVNPLVFRHTIFGPLIADNIYSWFRMGDRFAYWGLQVDDGDGGWASHSNGGQVAILGAEPDAWWTVDPYIPIGSTGALWRANLSISSAPEFGIRLETRLMHGTMQFKWRITNNDVVTRYAALKLAVDLNAGSIWGEDRPVISLPGYRFIEGGTVLQGSQIPEYLDAIDDIRSPLNSSRFIFEGNGATKPDLLAIDDWESTASNAVYSWDGTPDKPMFLYQPIPTLPIGDMAMAALWKPRAIRPGQYIEYISYIGMSEVTSRFDLPNANKPQYVPSLEGPRALSYPSVADDPKAPFEISAFLENHEMITLKDATATLILPEGLELDDSEDGQFTKSMGDIEPEYSTMVSWLVRPTGNPTGFLDYAVSFNASPVGGTVLTRTVNVPATPTQDMKENWQMISVPYRTSGYVAGHEILGLSGVYGVDYKLWKWDTKRKMYVRPPLLIPGEGYWLWLKSPMATQKNPKIKYTPITSGFQYDLVKGWNIIGNPYVYAITIGECKIYHPDYGIIDFDEAVRQRLISRTMYTYDTYGKRYINYSGRDTMLMPWQGYWFKALAPNVTINMSLDAQIGASFTAVSDKPEANTNEGPVITGINSIYVNQKADSPKNIDNTNNKVNTINIIDKTNQSQDNNMPDVSKETLKLNIISK